MVGRRLDHGTLVIADFAPSRTAIDASTSSLQRQLQARQIDARGSSLSQSKRSRPQRQLGDGRMRVKKLNVNRRHKAGEDEAAIGVAAGGDSEQRKWVSPTKPGSGGARPDGSNSGASSPTDVQQQRQHSPLQFHQTHSSSEHFTRGGSGGIMPNAAMHEEDAAQNPVRQALTRKIEETLRALKPHAPEKVLAALPRLAQHMERALYKLAKSEAEYRDPSTLPMRIAHIQENNAKRLLAQQQQQQRQSTPENRSDGKGAVPSVLKPLAEEQVRLVFQHLQSWRQTLVNMYGVAPWDIMPNPTLAKVALYMPSTEQELAACGVGAEQVARFGSSLVQELQHLRAPSAPPTKPANRPIKAKQGRKASPGKRGSSDSLAGGSNKKRKNADAPRLAPPASSFNGASLMAPPPAPLLPAVDSLPTLLPTVSLMPGGVTAASSATSNSMAMKQAPFATAAVRLSPAQPPQPSFFTRLHPQQQQQGSPSAAQENHMHLLVQGAGQLSKQQQQQQQNATSLEAYEQEVQSLRWMLHQSQQEKAQLEMEVQRLRAQLQIGE